MSISIKSAFAEVVSFSCRRKAHCWWMLLLLSCAEPGKSPIEESVPIDPKVIQPPMDKPAPLSIDVSSLAFTSPIEQKCAKSAYLEAKTFVLSSEPNLDGDLTEWKGSAVSISKQKDAQLYLAKGENDFFIGGNSLKEGDYWLIFFSSIGGKVAGGLAQKADRVLRVTKETVQEKRAGAWVDTEVADIERIQGVHTEIRISDRYLLSTAQNEFWMTKWVVGNSGRDESQAFATLLPSLLFPATTDKNLKVCNDWVGNTRNLGLEVASIGVPEPIQELWTSRYQQALQLFDQAFPKSSLISRPFGIILGNWGLQPLKQVSSSDDPLPNQHLVLVDVIEELESKVRYYNEFTVANALYHIASIALRRSYPNIDIEARHLFSILLAQSVLKNQKPLSWTLSSNWSFWNMKGLQSGEKASTDFLAKMNSSHIMEKWAVLLAHFTDAKYVELMIQNYALKHRLTQAPLSAETFNFQAFRQRMGPIFSELMYELQLESSLEKLYRWWLSPSDPQEDFGEDASQDKDLDGILGGIEIAIGTDPKNWDTDLDRWSEIGEILSGTDPLDQTIYPNKIVHDGSADDWFRLVPSSPILKQDVGINENCPATADISRHGGILTTDGLLLAISMTDDTILPDWQKTSFRIEIKISGREFWVDSTTAQKYAVLTDRATPLVKFAIPLLSPVSRETIEWSVLWSELGIQLSEEILNGVQFRFKSFLQNSEQVCDDTPWQQPHSSI